MHLIPKTISSRLSKAALSRKEKRQSLSCGTLAHRGGPVCFCILNALSDIDVVLPGMPEMLKPTSLIMGAGLGMDVASLTDGRFSGG